VRKFKDSNTFGFGPLAIVRKPDQETIITADSVSSEQIIERSSLNDSHWRLKNDQIGSPRQTALTLVAGAAVAQTTTETTTTEMTSSGYRSSGPAGDSNDQSANVENGVVTDQYQIDTKRHHRFLLMGIPHHAENDGNDHDSLTRRSGPARIHAAPLAAKTGRRGSPGSQVFA